MTTEKDCPSLKNSSKKSHGIPFSSSAQTACTWLLCSECLKPSIVYSRQKLKIHEEHALEHTFDCILFTCGSTLRGLEVNKLLSDPPSIHTLRACLLEKIWRVMKWLRYRISQVISFKIYVFTVLVQSTDRLKDNTQFVSKVEKYQY